MLASSAWRSVEREDVMPTWQEVWEPPDFVRAPFGRRRCTYLLMCRDMTLYLRAHDGLHPAVRVLRSADPYEEVLASPAGT